MLHYMDSPASSNIPSSTTSEAWNCRVDSFGVDGFAAQVKDLDPGYVIFTLGQNSGHFCSPNSAYDEVVGTTPSKLSRRDLIAEIADALAPGTKMIAYMPSNAPANDVEAIKRFGLVPPWDGGAWGLPKPPEGSLVADERLSEFQKKWERVLAEWGERWGDKVAGWWIDGCYFAETMYGGKDEPNFTSFARALRAGNPGRILAFNSGTDRPFERLAAEQDYTAGEVSTNFPVSNKWEPMFGKTDGMQTHVLSYLGDWWGVGEPRFSEAFVTGYTELITGLGGAMTWDVPISESGRIPPPFFERLRCLSRQFV